MLKQVLIAWLVMAFCVALHAMGLMIAVRWFGARAPGLGAGLVVATWPLVRIAAWTIILHLFQVVAWALLYAGVGAMPDFASAVYFSAVTYTTTGYGDLVLPPAWRLVGAVEALTGILMCGLSTGFFFAVANKSLGATALAQTRSPDATTFPRDPA